MTIDPHSIASNIISLPDPDKVQFLSQKLEEGSLDFARAFIYCENPNHSHDRNLALRVSIEKGHIELALEIIQLNDYGIDLEIEELVSFFAKKSSLATFLPFMQILDASKEDWNFAFLDALKSGNSEIAGYILAEKNLLPKFQLEALYYAADSGNLELMEILLDKGRLSSKVLDHLIRKCSEISFIGGLQLLRQKNFITDEGRGIALASAAQANKMEAIEHLLSFGPVDEKMVLRAFSIAAASGYGDILARLLATDQIKEAARSEAVMAAAINNRIEIVQQLRSLGTINTFALSGALVSFCEHQAFDLAISLLTSGPITNDSRSRALAATLRGPAELTPMQIELAIALLQSGEVTQEERENAVLSAVRLNLISLFSPALYSGPISLETRSRALSLAAFVQHRDFIADLVLNGPIGSLNIQEARLSCANQPDILAILSRAEIHVGGNWLMGSNSQNGNLMVPETLDVKIEELKENPAHYLSEVAARGLLKVVFLNSDGKPQAGIDGGGLTKQFVHQLMDALQLKEVIAVDEKRIPSYNRKDADLVAFGKFLSAVVSRNEGRIDKIFIGQIFDKKTFIFLQKILDPSLTERQKLLFIADQLKDEDNELYVNFALKEKPDDDEITLIRSNLCAIYDDSYLTASLEELTEGCLSSIKDGVFKALSLIASGLSDQLKIKILANPELVALDLQGVESFTKEEIFAKLKCANAHILDKVEWIKEKIAEELEKPESTWVKLFLDCVTGQPVLPAGCIELTGTTEKICIAHTCSCTIDLPLGEVSFKAEDAALSPKEKFIKNLEITMSVTEYGLT